MNNIKQYVLLGFIFLTQVAISMAPNLQSLNVLTLFPKKKTAKNITTMAKIIPKLFEQIKKSGKLPKNGTLVSSSNKQLPIWSIDKNLPTGLTEPIFIHSGPRDDTKGRMWYGSKGHSFKQINAWLRYGMITKPVVTFDYFYDKAGFDFGHGDNINCFGFIYKKLIQKNPQAPLIVVGTCVGAKIALEYAAHNKLQQTQAMVLESPYIDPHKIISNLQNNYKNFMFRLPILNWFMAFYFKNWKQVMHIPHADLRKISSSIPIFIAHLHNDKFYDNDDMFKLIRSLLKSGNKNIYLLVIDDPKLSHGHLNNKPEFIRAVNAFLAAHKLPHDSDLAQEGRQLLEDAHENAFKEHYNQWEISQLEN